MRLRNARALVVRSLERSHLLDNAVDAIVRHDSEDIINLLQSSFPYSTFRCPPAQL